MYCGFRNKFLKVIEIVRHTMTFIVVCHLSLWRNINFFVFVSETSSDLFKKILFPSRNRVFYCGGSGMTLSFHLSTPFILFSTSSHLPHPLHLSTPSSYPSTSSPPPPFSLRVQDWPGNCPVCLKLQRVSCMQFSQNILSK